MNVSSVKNLNGEVFSAVQDASLTEFVQTNSASWSGDNNIYYINEGHAGQDILSAYSAGKRIVVKMNDGNFLPVYKTNNKFYGYYILDCWSNPDQLKIQQYTIDMYNGETNKQTVTNPGVADWNCTNSADMRYIWNKPYIPDMSTVVQYSAAGLNFPNSNFKVDTSGNVYKITREGEETKITGKAYINNEEISFVLNGTFEPGTYEFRMPDHYLTLTNPDGGTALTVTNGVAKWVNTSEKTFSWKYLSPGPRGEPFLTTSNGSVWLVPSDIDLKYQLECDMSAYAYTSAVDNKLDTSSFSDVSSTFLTAHQPISAEEWNSNYETVTTNSGAWGGEALPITGRDGIDLEIDNGILYIGASALTGVVNTYEQNSASYVVENNFEYDSNDLITAYNGSAFAGQGGGGGDVPTGTMNVSGLEYNAVNEISGYNGSAIAQYGAEKQWLVHDDTLVHASNSAQYALGVAIDNVARLLHIDETVLWSGDEQLSIGEYIELSESPRNFEYVRLDFAHQPGWGGKHSETIPNFGDSTSGNFVIGENWFRNAAGYNNMWHNLSYETFNSANNRIYHNSGFQGIVNNTAWNTNGNLQITYYKVVGIGRKQ